MPTPPIDRDKLRGFRHRHDGTDLLVRQTYRILIRGEP